MPSLHISDVLIKPIITEKNTRLTEMGQYTFEVAPTANKIKVKEAVEKIFNVRVTAVNVLIVKGKRKTATLLARVRKHRRLVAIARITNIKASADGKTVSGTLKITRTTARAFNKVAGKKVARAGDVPTRRSVGWAVTGGGDGVIGTSHVRGGRVEAHPAVAAWAC